MRVLSLMVGLSLMVAANLAPTPSAAANASPYADPANWLCRPGRTDACSVDLTATVIGADGAISKHGFSAAPNPPVDCFYVYPTVSRQPTANSDRAADPEEVAVAKMQLALFGQKCRLFAPLYRQATIASLEGKVAGGDLNLAYADVLDAWTEYLAHDNQGRGVVLIGHSQGSRLLRRLIAEQIDGKPVQRQLVSAIIPGAAIAAPTGGGAGGRLQDRASMRQGRSGGLFHRLFQLSGRRIGERRSPLRRRSRTGSD